MKTFSTKRILMILLLATAAGGLQAQTVQIGATSYGTIQEAIDAAAEGDVIDITGVHTELITINKGITLQGTDPTTDIIQAAASKPASGAGGSSVIFIPSGISDENITVQNIGVQNSNAEFNGGGLTVAGKGGQVLLRNMIFQNCEGSNGGAIFLRGANNVTLDGLTVRNNVARSGGGGIFIVSANDFVYNSEYTIQNSVFHSNSSSFGGAIMANGAIGAGDERDLFVNVINTTVFNNTMSAGNGGAMLFAVAEKVVGGTPQGVGNMFAELVHVTMFDNVAAANLPNSGLRFNKNFSQAETVLAQATVYNSLMLGADTDGGAAINLGAGEITAAQNNIWGAFAFNNLPAAVNDAANNNTIDATAASVGLSTSLANEGGDVEVLALNAGSSAIDYCSVATGITLPNTDARGLPRDATPDAGAFEVQPSNAVPTVETPIGDETYTAGFGTATVDLTGVFADADDDNLDLSALSGSTGVVTVEVTGTTLNITEVGTGVSTVTVTADDGNGGSISDDFTVTVQAPDNQAPTVQTPIGDETYADGFGTATVDLTGVFIDPDGDDLTLSATSSSTTVVTVEVTGTTTLTITEVGAGTSTVTVTAADGNGGSISDEFTVTVEEPANQLPVVVVSIGSLEYEQGFSSATISLNGAFSDPDGDDLTLSASSADASVVTAAVSGTTLTVTEVGVGTTTITLTAEDGRGGSVTDDVTVTVSPVLGLIEAAPFRLFPVPVRSTLHVQGSGQIDRATVYNLSGQAKEVELMGTPGNYTLDLKQLDAGVYIMLFDTPEGLFQQRFIKESL